MNDPSDIDELLKGDPSQFHKDLQEATPQKSELKSAADELIDVIGEVEAPRRVLTCPSCKGTEFTTRKSVGAGATIHVCASCRTKVHGPSRTNARMIACKKSSTPAGPYYKPSRPQSPVGKNTPKHRRKGRSMSALKKD